MDYSKINMKICKALSIGEDVRGYWSATVKDGETLFVTVDGTHGYFIPKDKIIFDASRVKMLDVKLFNPLDYVKDDNRIDRTNHFVKIDSRFCRRFNGNGYRVYVNQNYLDIVEKYPIAFFQNVQEKKDMSKQPVLVAEQHGADFTPIMVACPVFILDDK